MDPVIPGYRTFRHSPLIQNRKSLPNPIPRLEGRMKAEAEKSSGLSEIEGQTLRSTLWKGWYWGGESFKETLVQKLEGLKGGSMPVAKDFRSSDQARDHDLWGSERMISKAVQQFALKRVRREKFTALPRGDLRPVESPPLPMPPRRHTFEI